MGKGPAVIRLIECWKRRQKKWLEIILVLKADTDSSFGLNHYSLHFWELLSSSPGAHRPWVLLEPGNCLLRYLPKLCCPPQPSGTNQLLLLPCCAYGTREERPLARQPPTNCQVSLTGTEEETFPKVSIVIHKTLNTSKSGSDSLAWCPGSCLT